MRVACLVRRLGWLPVLLVGTLALSDDIPLRRDPGAYFALGIRSAKIKDLAIEPPGCNVGVNCAPTSPGKPCGRLRGKGASVEAPGQVAANAVCLPDPPLPFFQVFDAVPLSCTPTCDDITHSGVRADCTDQLAVPLLDDLDGDGHASCTDCTPDPEDVALACGVTLPLPVCGGSDLVVPVDGDVTLPAGIYRDVLVGNGGRLTFAAGTTVVCSLRAGNSVRVTSTGPATVFVTGGHPILKFKNDADVGSVCHALRFVVAGTITLGRHGDYIMDACALTGRLGLGHGNSLQGNFIGDILAADRANDGRCCDAGTTTTTTSSTMTTTSSHTTTSSSTTTTSTSTSTTTTTDPCGDGVLDPGETCDPPGSATCPPSSPGGAMLICTASCTCPAPVGTPTTSTTSSTSSTSSSSTSTTSSSTSTSSTSTSSSSSSSSTSTPTSSTTTSTTPAGAFTRTLGFYKTHPAITQSILTAAGGVSVCGHLLTDVDVNHGHSALEALCVSPHGDQRLQLVRQLTAAALNIAAGTSASFPGFATCNALCQSPSASKTALSNCIDAGNAFNQSGDALPAPFDPPGSANSTPCDQAGDTACTILSPALCAAP